MSLYPITVKRCQHIKVNGTQCGSPALRDSKCCYYHIRYHWPELEALQNNNEWRKPLATLEDANSIQVSLANVMERGDAGNRSQDGSAVAVCVADGVHEPETNLAGTGTADAGCD